MIAPNVYTTAASFPIIAGAPQSTRSLRVVGVMHSCFRDWTIIPYIKMPLWEGAQIRNWVPVPSIYMYYFGLCELGDSKEIVLQCKFGWACTNMGGHMIHPCDISYTLSPCDTMVIAWERANKMDLQVNEKELTISTFRKEAVTIFKVEHQRNQNKKRQWFFSVFH